MAATGSSSYHWNNEYFQLRICYTQEMMQLHLTQTKVLKSGLQVGDGFLCRNWWNSLLLLNFLLPLSTASAGPCLPPSCLVLSQSLPDCLVFLPYSDVKTKALTLTVPASMFSPKHYILMQECGGWTFPWFLLLCPNGIIPLLFQGIQSVKMSSCSWVIISIKLIF